MTLTVPEILEQIRFPRGRFPREAVEAAIERREEVAPELLRILDEAAERPEELLSDEARMDHLFALYLLGQFREPAAYPRVVRFFRLPGEVTHDATGDVVTEALDRILASVCHGDVRPIQRLIEDPEVNEWVRGAGVRALSEMVMSDQLSRDEVIAYLGELLRGGIEREPSHVWDAIADVATDLHPQEVAAEVWRAYDEGLIDPFFISREDVERELDEPREIVLARSRRRSQGLIGNAVEEMSRWACFNERPRRDRGQLADQPASWEDGDGAGGSAVHPVRRAEPKVGRNDPCPCGSGKKYKKCCGARPGAR